MILVLEIRFVACQLFREFRTCPFFSHLLRRLVGDKKKGREYRTRWRGCSEGLTS